MQVEGGLITQSLRQVYKTMIRVASWEWWKTKHIPVASRGWICNWDNNKLWAQSRVDGGLATGTTTNCDPSCVLRMDLQLRQLQNNEPTCESSVDLQLGWNKLRSQLRVNDGLATGPKKAIPSCKSIVDLETELQNKTIGPSCVSMVYLQLKYKKVMPSYESTVDLQLVQKVTP